MTHKDKIVIFRHTTLQERHPSQNLSESIIEGYTLAKKPKPKTKKHGIQECAVESKKQYI